MRRCSRILKINLKTVSRKVEYLAKKSRMRQEKLLFLLQKSQVEKMQFDDLITLEHTKMKPLSVSLAVDKDRRIILGAEVSRIPAFGHLAKKSVKKYGYRENHHIRGLNRLFLQYKKRSLGMLLLSLMSTRLIPLLFSNIFIHVSIKDIKEDVDVSPDREN